MDNSSQSLLLAIFLLGALAGATLVSILGIFQEKNRRDRDDF